LIAIAGLICVTSQNRVLNSRSTVAQAAIARPYRRRNSSRVSSFAGTRPIMTNTHKPDTWVPTQAGAVLMFPPRAPVHRNPNWAKCGGVSRPNLLLQARNAASASSDNRRSEPHVERTAALGSDVKRNGVKQSAFERPCQVRRGAPGMGPIGSHGDTP
jgi:hypothetical protein